MLARVQSYVLSGIDALACEVEIDADMRNAENKAMLVGLPDSAVKESIERVKSALANSGASFPPGRVLINLAPAEIRKEGPLYDLPIAVGLLAAMGVLNSAPVPVRRSASASPPAAATTGGATSSHASRAAAGAPASNTLHASSAQPDLREWLLAGELALDGRLRPVKGVIAMAAMAKARGFRGVIVPRENVAEAAVVVGVDAVGAATLSEVIGILSGSLDLSPHPPVDVVNMLRTAEAPIDFVEVRGQEAVKRALVVAAAGSHNCMQLWPTVRHGNRGLPRPVGPNRREFRPTGRRGRPSQPRPHAPERRPLGYTPAWAIAR